MSKQIFKIVELIQKDEIALLDIPEHLFSEAVGKYSVATFSSTANLLEYLETGQHFSYSLEPGESIITPDGRTVHGSGIHSAMKALNVRQSNSYENLPEDKLDIISAYVESDNPGLSAQALEILLTQDVKTSTPYGEGKGHKALSEYLATLPEKTQQESRISLLTQMFTPLKEEMLDPFSDFIENGFKPYYKTAEDSRRIEMLNSILKLAYSSQKTTPLKTSLLKLFPELSINEESGTLTTLLRELVRNWEIDYQEDETLILQALNSLPEDGQRDAMFEINDSFLKKLKTRAEEIKIGEVLLRKICSVMEYDELAVLISSGIVKPSETGVNIPKKIKENAVEATKALSEDILFETPAEDIVNCLISTLQEGTLFDNDKKDMLLSLSSEGFFSKLNSVVKNETSMIERADELNRIVKNIYNLPDSLPIGYAERVIILGSETP